MGASIVRGDAQWVRRPVLHIERPRLFNSSHMRTEMGFHLLVSLLLICLAELHYARQL